MSNRVQQAIQGFTPFRLALTLHFCAEAIAESPLASGHTSKTVRRYVRKLRTVTQARMRQLGQWRVVS